MPIAGAPIEKLLDLLKEPEDRTRYRARTELAARDTKEVLAALKNWIDKLDKDGPDYERLMLEACEATNNFWFDTLGRSVLRELKAMDNEASRRLSECQSMRLIWEGEREFVSGRLPAQIWELDASEWRRRNSDRLSAS